MHPGAEPACIQSRCRFFPRPPAQPAGKVKAQRAGQVGRKVGDPHQIDASSNQSTPSSPNNSAGLIAATAEHETSFSSRSDSDEGSDDSRSGTSHESTLRTRRSATPDHPYAAGPSALADLTDGTVRVIEGLSGLGVDDPHSAKESWRVRALKEFSLIPRSAIQCDICGLHLHTDGEHHEFICALGSGNGMRVAGFLGSPDTHAPLGGIKDAWGNSALSLAVVFFGLDDRDIMRTILNEHLPVDASAFDGSLS